MPESAKAIVALSVCSLSVGIAGCVQLRPTEDARGSETAKLRVISESPDHYSAWVFVTARPSESSDHHCKSLSIFANLGGGSNILPKLEGMVDEPPLTSAVMERTVPANDRYYVSFSPLFRATIVDNTIRSARPAHCDGIAFTPLPGQQYEIAIRLGSGSCDVRLRSLSDGGAKVPSAAMESSHFPCDSISPR